jgi:PD-(D/E)XK endonuclease
MRPPTSGPTDTLLAVLTTNQKGVVAETAIVHQAVRHGIGVWLPVSSHERYDLIFDADGRLSRVQCKTAVRVGDVLVVRLYSTRRCATGLLKRAYSADEIDAFAAFSPDTGKCYYLEMSEFAGHTELSLRLHRTRNNQAQGVRWARDYEFRATLGALLGP